MALPESFLAHLRGAGYNSRSDKHSNALAMAIIDDLIANCDEIAARARSGRLVYQINSNVGAGTLVSNVDLVLGAPPLGQPAASGETIRRADPATIQIALEFKSLMTEHRKQVKNRRRDFEALHEHVHAYDQRAIAGGVMVVNISPTFQSTLRPDPTAHRAVESLVQHCLNEMRGVSTRSGLTGVGLDAAAFFIVNMDNVNWPTTTYHETPPAPRVGDPLHYDSFIRRLCDEFTIRFAR